MSTRDVSEQRVATRPGPIVSVIAMLALIAAVGIAVFASDYYEADGRFFDVTNEAPVEPGTPPVEYIDGAPTR